MKKIIILNLTLAITIYCSGQEKKEHYNPKAIEMNNKAAKLMQIGKNDSALILFDKAIEIDKTYYLAHSNKIGIYLDKKDLDKALIESEKCLALKPDYVEGWTLAGLLYDTKGKSSKALNCYNKSIELLDKSIADPNKKNNIKSNRASRAVSLILMGKETEGKNELRKLKSEYPDMIGLDELLKINKKDYLKLMAAKLKPNRPTTHN
jgi:tetratricopeptide (TPR) repeat protein